MTHTLAHTAGTATHALQWQTKVISHRNDRKAAVDFCIAYFCGSLNCVSYTEQVYNKARGGDKQLLLNSHSIS